MHLPFLRDLHGALLRVDGRREHVLRRTDDGLRLVRKVVRLVDNDQAQFTLAFVI